MAEPSCREHQRNWKLLGALLGPYAKEPGLLVTQEWPKTSALWKEEVFSEDSRNALALVLVRLSIDARLTGSIRSGISVVTMRSGLNCSNVLLVTECIRMLNAVSMSPDFIRQS